MKLQETFLSHGEPLADLSLCALEPVHTPSSIQPHGVLIAVRYSDLQVVYVSANSKEYFNIGPAHILSQKLPALMGPEAIAAIYEASLGEQCPATSIPVFSYPVFGDKEFDVVVSRLGDLICIEFEPKIKGSRWDLLSKRMQATTQELRRQKTQSGLWNVAVMHLRTLTDYDRVMVYRFDRDQNGEVIAEEKDPAMEPFLGLHYPASDIPVQARRLYLTQHLRTITDIGYHAVPVMGHPEVATDERLDMTYCTLRGVSPVHLEYLHNMGVGATLAISLVHKNELWGMVVCHHRTPKHLDPERRAFCDFLGQLLSMLIDVTTLTEEYAALAKKQEFLEILDTVMLRDEDIGASLAVNAHELCSLVEADGAAIQFAGQLRLVGETPSLPESRSLMAALRPHLKAGFTATSEIGKLLPEFAYLAPLASGVSMIQVMSGPSDAILWFRKEIINTIHWGGDPDAPKATVDRDARIHPRKSFESWAQIQRGRSLPWLEAETRVARNLQRLVTNAHLRHTEAKLAQLSHFDPLTALPNRRVLISRLTDWQIASPESAAALLFLDVDRFKTVNDSLGHSIGDQLLIQVAERLRQCAGATHLVARLGGDEFVIFCKNISAGDAEQLAANIILAVAEQFVLNGKPFHTTTSIGVACMGRHSPTWGMDPLQAADSAMYVAKQKGGNQFSFYEIPQIEQARRRLLLEQGLFRALKRQELFIVYQPIFAVDSLHLLGFEALLRWEHPEYGSISPAEFIPLAEHTGQIVPIGTWVLNESLRQVRRWRERSGTPLFVAVNVSARQLARNDLRNAVNTALDDAGVPANALQLEVTESILMHDQAATQLEEIRATGVIIAVDDFGTGYSSISYLERLPLDKIKIDHQFMEKVGEDERKSALFGAIVAMAHTLGLKVVGEGVESEIELNCLKRVFCDAVQGYFLAKPLLPQQVEDRMDNGWTVCHVTPTVPRVLGSF